MQSVKFLQISSECSQRVQLLAVLQQFAAIEFKGFKSAFYYQKITKNDVTDDEICRVVVLLYTCVSTQKNLCKSVLCVGKFRKSQHKNKF